jgi:hypothetical protein
MQHVMFFGQQRTPARSHVCSVTCIFDRVFPCFAAHVFFVEKRRARGCKEEMARRSRSQRAGTEAAMQKEHQSEVFSDRHGTGHEGCIPEHSGALVAISDQCKYVASGSCLRG